MPPTFTATSATKLPIAINRIPNDQSMDNQRTVKTLSGNLQIKHGRTNQTTITPQAPQGHRTMFVTNR